MLQSHPGLDRYAKSALLRSGAVCLLLWLLNTALIAHAETKQSASASPLPKEALAREYFGADALWYLEKIPFLDIDNAEIQQIYYYRWKLYRAHLRDLGDRGYIVTEFLDDVGWDRRPYASLNDATGLHIYDGRWLKDDLYMDDYIDYMVAGGGNDRHFSEAITDAVYARFLVNGDAEFATKHLDAMRETFHQWDDHFDFDKGLYYIEPIADATEYSIASIDASGGKDGFLGGEAFRPTINSYMYANAVAISKLAAMKGEGVTASEFANTAARLKLRLEQSLWSKQEQHFIDRYKADKGFAKYWAPIRGRELAGYVPWYFNIPDDSEKYSTAWKHLLSSSDFLGAYGLRTTEPSYQYYMKQYRYDRETNGPECQWNGPSWPYQTTQVLSGMANLLNNYSHDVVSPSDFVRLLKLYTHQHYLGTVPDLQEDYSPDTGAVIVGLKRSHHYNHSGYIDLVISGLIGIRPRADNILEIHPLIPSDPRDPNFIRYFRLEDALYHGHLITVQFDYDGKRYGNGAGLSVYADGALVASRPLGKIRVQIPAPVKIRPAERNVDVAVNIYKSGFPKPSSSDDLDSKDLYKPLDGRIVFFPEALKGWTTRGTKNSKAWYSVDFGVIRQVSSMALYFYEDGSMYKAPSEYQVQYWDGSTWEDVPGGKTATPVANGESLIHFTRVSTQRVRVLFDNLSMTRDAVLLDALKVY